MMSPEKQKGRPFQSGPSRLLKSEAQVKQVLSGSAGSNTYTCTGRETRPLAGRREAVRIVRRQTRIALLDYRHPKTKGCRKICRPVELLLSATIRSLNLDRHDQP